MRIAAARKAKLESVPIFIDDLDDDTMLRLMTDENALQSGENPGAVMNEVAAVTRRLIEGLLSEPDNCPVQIAKAFANKAAIEMARGKLRNGEDTHLTLGHNVIRAYLGQGNLLDCISSAAVLGGGDARSAWLGFLHLGGVRPLAPDHRGAAPFFFVLMMILRWV